MFRYLFSIISFLFIIISPCVANIASSEYVNEMRDNVQAKIDKKADNANYTQNMVLQTDNSGNVVATTVGTDLFADGAIETMHLTDGAVTNADLAGMIDIKKLNLGTLPTSGKHMMIWNAETNEYVFEAFAESASSGLQCPAGQYDIGFSQCIDPATNGSAYGYRNDSTGAMGADSYSESVYGLTTDQTWGVTFDGYGNVKGIASCNGTKGTRNQSTTTEFSQTDTGRYCWCKMTEPAASRWVFGDDFGSNAYNCASNCADYCGYGVQNFSFFRSGVFGSVGQ